MLYIPKIGSFSNPPEYSALHGTLGTLFGKYCLMLTTESVGRGKADSGPWRGQLMPRPGSHVRGEGQGKDGRAVRWEIFVGLGTSDLKETGGQ